MRALLCLLATTSCSLPEPLPSYQINLRGAVVLTARGAVDAGPAGTAAEPYYSIALTGPDGAAAVFTRVGAEPPPPGVYSVGERGSGEHGFSGLIITGMPAHPSGVFQARSGTLTLTAEGAGRLAGEFALEAAGFLTGAPEEDHRTVAAEGSFTARIRPAADSPDAGI